MMKCRKGVLGSFTVTFIATVAIVLILLVFALISGAVNLFNFDGIRIPSEVSLGVGQTNDYLGKFDSLVNARFFLEKGSKLHEVLQEYLWRY